MAGEHEDPGIAVFQIGGRDLYSTKAQGEYICRNPDCPQVGATQIGSLFWEGTCPPGRHFVEVVNGKILDRCTVAVKASTEE